MSWPLCSEAMHHGIGHFTWSVSLDNSHLGYDAGSSRKNTIMWPVRSLYRLCKLGSLMCNCIWWSTIFKTTTIPPETWWFATFLRCVQALQALSKQVLENKLERMKSNIIIMFFDCTLKWLTLNHAPDLSVWWGGLTEVRRGCIYKKKMIKKKKDKNYT